jgi:hypothetical protein
MTLDDRLKRIAMYGPSDSDVTVLISEIERLRHLLDLAIKTIEAKTAHIEALSNGEVK